MDYLELIESQKQEHMALVTDSAAYTYGQLAQAAREIRSAHPFDRPAEFIHEEKIDRQLLRFIALSGTKTVPIIATEASRKQRFEVGEITAAACMGVMTSGSTGQSKLLWRSYGSWADFFPEQNRIFGIDENSVIFCQGSLAFTGNLNIYMGVLGAGGTLVATEKFRPKHWLEMIEKYSVNGLYLIPSKLLLLPKFMRGQNHALKVIVSGSQTMGRREADKLLQVFPNADITLYYGASELNYITYIKGNEMTDDGTDIGRPFKGVGVEVRGSEIFIDTPYHVENITVPFSLKDRGSMDQQGHLHFLGRLDDICSVNGRKVSTAKVESVLSEQPGVSEAAVLSMHHGDADVLTAFLTADTVYSKQQMLKLLQETCLETYEMPDRFIFLDGLPHNESGKIDRLKLRREYEGK